MYISTSTEFVNIDTIGKCEHCHTLLEMIFAGDAVNGTWKCSECNKKLTHRSFGFETAKSRKRIQWVGKKGQWVDGRPTSNFFLKRGKWYVYVDGDRPLF
jgi:ribosomal protein L37AE/L43A